MTQTFKYRILDVNETIIWQKKLSKREAEWHETEDPLGKWQKFLITTGNLTKRVRNKKLVRSSTVLLLCLGSQMQSCCSHLFNLATYQRIPYHWKSPEPYLLLLVTHNYCCSKWIGTLWKIRLNRAATTTLWTKAETEYSGSFHYPEVLYHRYSSCTSTL